MATATLIIVGVFLLICSVIDWKLRVLPSILLTAMLFTVAFLYPQNLWFGIMGLIMAYLLYEADFFSGIADVKVMTMLAFMVSTTNWFFGLVVFTVTYGLFWKVLIKFKIPQEKDIAFIPVLLFVYITLILIGGIN